MVFIILNSNNFLLQLTYNYEKHVPELQCFMNILNSLSKFAIFKKGE